MIDRLTDSNESGERLKTSAPTCKNLRILHAALPANHCIVDVQTASVTLQKKVTMRSAVARCVRSRLIVERRRRIRYIRASVAELPISATTNMIDKTTVCMTESCVSRGTSIADAVVSGAVVMSIVRPPSSTSSTTVCSVVNARSFMATWDDV